ncbi:hypothetical protein Bhyg_06697 [Pseudolycoriella hygida]|uniref:Uncharacterized protein n=1 Tax=Pseudolycoriella hygida TaxID=35572 RepID=A0A9Q0N281_9DIPT|nr:hypothetical protein Bhyg_06697 [Pseudolycoriella hygida]
MENSKRKKKQFKNIKSYITVEPVLFAITIPYCLLVICMQNLTLEKITVTTTFMLYVAKTFDMFGGLRSLVVRSIISTVVDITEIGKIYSVVGVLENLGKFIFVPVYTNIYKYTVDTFPNAYFICSFVVIIIVTVLFVFLHRWVEPQPRPIEEPSNESSNFEKQNAIEEPC